MKKSVRLLSLLFATVMLLTAVACKKDKPVEQETTIATTGQAGGDRYDENGFLLNDLPELNYEGEEIEIVHWTPTVNEFEITQEETSDAISWSIWSRNTAVEQSLNVALVYVEFAAGGADTYAFAQYVEGRSMSNDPFDFIAGYSRATPLCATRGLCLDLFGLEYLNFNQPWWPQSLVSEAQIGGKLYYASGDVSPNLLYNMTTLFYNKQLLIDNGIESPVDHVNDGTWTMEVMNKMIKDYGQDLNTNYRKDKEDRYGLVTLDHYMEDIFEACGLRFYDPVDEGDDQLFKLSESYYGSMAIDLSADLLKMNVGDDVLFSTNSTECNPVTIFENGRSMFLLSSVNVINTSGLRDVNWKYGIVPWPLYDADLQERFSTATRYPFTMYGVFSQCENPERAGAVLECLASEAYRKISPEVFERAMKLRYSDASEDAKMFDLLRANIVFENGRLLSQSQTTNMGVLFYGSVIGGDNWKTVSNQNKAKLEAEIEELSDLFMELINQDAAE